MNGRRSRSVCLLAVFVCAANLSLGAGLASPETVSDPVLDALAGEIQRAMTALAESDPAPYFIAAELTEVESVQMTGEAGGIHGYSPGRRRWLDVDLRVGSRALDSSHALRSGKDRPSRAGRLVPLSDDPQRIRHALWLEIDKRYQQARERWAAVEAESKVLVEEEPAEDLVEVQPVGRLGPESRLEYEAARWEHTVKRASRILVEHPTVIEGAVGFAGASETTWFVSSEGTRIRHGASRSRLDVRIEAIADDGDNVRLYRSFDSRDADRLPNPDEAVAAARQLVSDLAELAVAPFEEPYSGPAILSDRAAAVFFHEIFGHRVEGHRLKRVDNAQTFRNRVGQRILPGFLSVYDDPTLPSAAATDLNGHYGFDDQGVPAERVVLVENGVLRGFLQSRSPVEQGDRSNGHGRRQQGHDPVSRQGSLIVEATQAVDDAELRRQLIELAQEQGRDYALYVDEIQGGFTFTDREMPNAYSVNAVRVRRIFVDGRPDQLVRGVDLIGTPLESFAKILRAGEVHAPFNGSCGAESGWVPVSAVAPSLLLESIETQRKRKDQATPPILPPPLPDGPGSGGNGS